MARSELSRRQKTLFICAVLAGIPLFVGLRFTSGNLKWVFIAIGEQ